jgi:hypothetical protein
MLRRAERRPGSNSFPRLNLRLLPALLLARGSPRLIAAAGDSVSGLRDLALCKMMPKTESLQPAARSQYCVSFVLQKAEYYFRTKVIHNSACDIPSKSDSHMNVSRSWVGHEDMSLHRKSRTAGLRELEVVHNL